MIRLIYSGSVSSQPSAERLSRFLEDSRQRNQRDGICGVMVLIGQDFLQVIEGPEEDVDRYYAQAFSDTKRYNLILLSRQTIDRPIFGSWSLGLIRAEPNMDPHQPGGEILLQIEQIDPQDSHARHTLQVIREFIDGKWHHHLPLGNNPVTIRRTHSR